MKFRALITDFTLYQKFSRVIFAISRLVKICILRLTVDRIYFILIERAVTGCSSFWFELSQSNFFNEFALEGVNVEEANEIFLEICPDNISKILKCSLTAKSLKIKLTKKNGIPYLTLEVEQPTYSGPNRLVIHDIPIEVIQRKYWFEMLEPNQQTFDISFYMPALRGIRSVLDKMKNIAAFATLQANWDNTFIIKCDQMLVNIQIKFTDISYPIQSEMNLNMEGDKSELFEARVDLKKLCQLFSSIEPNKVICNIVHEHLIIFIFIHEDFQLKYYIPSTNL